jgi:TonB family protein
MRFYLLSLLFIPCFVRSQTLESDTLVYDYVESAPIPMLSSCINSRPPQWNMDSVRACASYGLLALVSGNIRYPEDARINQVQGTVVVSFIVEISGRITAIKLLRDIGGGCGAEAVRVVTALDEAGLRWQPGLKDNRPVRVRYNLPLKFKLQEELPFYTLPTGDTIYSMVETPATFRGGADSLSFFIENELVYPTKWKGECKTGVVESSLVIYGNGALSVDNQLDFNGLGLDFEFECIRLAKKTQSLWVPATFDGRPVNTLVPVRFVFKSPASTCLDANYQFDKAQQLGWEALELMESDKLDLAIDKLTQAIEIQPNNSEWLYYRGTNFLNKEMRTEACADFNAVKSKLGFTWFEGIRKLMCGF